MSPPVPWKAAAFVQKGIPSWTPDTYLLTPSELVPPPGTRIRQISCPVFDRTADIGDVAEDPPRSRYFPPPDAVPDPLLAILAGQLGIETVSTDTAGLRGAKSHYRYHAAVRSHLKARSYDPRPAAPKITGVILDAARTMSDPADLINRAIANAAWRDDRPSWPFSTLDVVSPAIFARGCTGVFSERSASRLTSEQTAALDALLVRPEGAATTGFNRLKQTPGPATHSRRAPGRTV